MKERKRQCYQEFCWASEGCWIQFHANDSYEQRIPSLKYIKLANKSKNICYM